VTATPLRAALRWPRARLAAHHPDRDRREAGLSLAELHARFRSKPMILSACLRLSIAPCLPLPRQTRRQARDRLFEC